MFPLFVFLLVLSGIGQSVGFAILGGRGGGRNTGAGQERRQAITPFLPPPMSTIFLGGDSAKPKTASSGYAAQIDIINDIWGFCPTSAPVQKCGLPGSCVDSHACSKGCGFTDDSSLPTITCNDYCITGLLTATSGLGPFTSFACAKSPSTENYLAFTTKQAVTPLPVPTTKSSSTAALTSSTRGPTPSSAPTTKPAVSTTSPPNTSSVSEPTASASSSATGSNGDINSNNDIDINSGNTNNTNSSNSNTFNINNPNTIGAIIGGVVGCLALICIAVVLVIWLRRRYRKEKNESDPKPTSKSSSSSSSSSSSTFPFSPNPSIKDMIDQTGGDYTFPRDGAKEVEALPPKYPIPAAVHVSSREVKYPPVYEVENREYRRGGWIPSSGPRELPGGRSPKEMENNWLQNMPVELPAGSVYWKGQHPREGVPF